MRIIRGFFVLLAICAAGFPAFAQRLQGGIPFLDTASKNVRSGELVVNAEAVSALKQTSDSVTITGVPLITGALGDFILKPAKAFSDDVQFIAIEAGGTTRAVSVTPKRGWIGSDPNHPDRSMFISANAESQLHAIVMGDDQTSVTVIAPDNTAAGVYKIVANNLPQIPFCDDLADLMTSTGSPSAVPATREIRSTTMYDIELTLDISNDLYIQLNQSNERLIDYLVDLIGSMNIIYHRDLQANWVVNNVFIWDTPDPFSAPHPADGDPTLTTKDQLYNYQDYVLANRGATHYDVTHLLDTKEGLGGLAYLNVLQNTDGEDREIRSGVSNVFGTDDFPADINTYYWDTMVISHELGHNVGSPHTHCYTPPIDCCSVEQGCSGCTTAAPAAGTIMSYCHLWIGNGGSMQMFFHSRCVALMRPLIESSPLVSVHTSAPGIEVFGVFDIYVAPGSTAGEGATLKSRTVGGAVVDQVFTITNSGDVTLLLTGSPAVTISGNSNLSIVAQPAVTSLAPGASTSFTVRYNPAVSGTVTATISIPNNSATPNYSFQVIGQIVEPSPPVTITFNGNVPIGEATGFYTQIPIAVTGVPGSITDVNLRFNGSNCSDPTQTGLQHPYVGQLQLRLVSPDGTAIFIMDQAGDSGMPSSGDNLCNTLFDDNPAAPSIQTILPAGAPYSGTYRPIQALAAFNGESPNGTWYLQAYDYSVGQSGSVRSVSLIISGEQPAAGVTDWVLYR